MIRSVVRVECGTHAREVTVWTAVQTTSEIIAAARVVTRGWRASLPEQRDTLWWVLESRVDQEATDDELERAWEMGLDFEETTARIRRPLMGRVEN